MENNMDADEIASYKPSPLDLHYLQSFIVSGRVERVYYSEAYHMTTCLISLNIFYFQ